MIMMMMIIDSDELMNNDTWLDLRHQGESSVPSLLFVVLVK